MERSGVRAVAHDLNNLLALIRGYAELATEQVTDPVVLAELDEITGAAARASDLTRQLLDG